MAKSNRKYNRAPEHVLKLPDLEQSKSAVLNSLTSAKLATNLRSRDQRIHRVVLFRTQARLQQDCGYGSRSTRC
jgi:hypothetical protein